jgi:hypothetical protein
MTNPLLVPDLEDVPRDPNAEPLDADVAHRATPEEVDE